MKIITVREMNIVASEIITYDGDDVLWMRWWSRYGDNYLWRR